MFKSIEQQIFDIAIHHPSKIAIIDCHGKEYTYSELADRILFNVREFKGHDISEGDGVLIIADKDINFISSYFAIHLLGAIAIPIESEISEKRLSFIIEETNSKFIIGNLSKSVNDNLVSLYSHFDFDGFSKDQEIKSFPENTVSDIIFTTGTTGTPKGVLLTNLNEVQSAININTFIGNGNNDIELLALPLCHSFGLGRLRCNLILGATVVLMDGFTNVKLFFENLKKYHITGFAMVPSGWNYLSLLSRDKISEFAGQLKYIEIGSAYMSLQNKLHLMELLPDTKICMHYGLTEASRSSFISFHDEKDKLDTIGRPSPNSEIVILSESNVILPPNSEGEIAVKGNHVTPGYLNKLEKSESEEYFRTGDIGFIDDEGYIHLKSRKKEMINVGGKKVSPVEVEEVLESMDGIIEAACVGMSDPILGEAVKAFVVAAKDQPGIKEIKEFVSKKLESYKVPSKVEFIEKLPRTKSGKLLRLNLKNT